MMDNIRATQLQPRHANVIDVVFRRGMLPIVMAAASEAGSVHPG